DADWLKYDLDRDGHASSSEIETVYTSWLNTLQRQHAPRLDSLAKCMRPALPEVAVAAVRAMAPHDPILGFTREEFDAVDDAIPERFDQLRSFCEQQVRDNLWWSRYDTDHSGTITVSEVAAV